MTMQNIEQEPEQIPAHDAEPRKGCTFGAEVCAQCRRRIVLVEGIWHHGRKGF